MLGDKVYGLVLADALGFSVPRTNVIARRIPPFTFGQPSGSLQKWVRTAPQVKTPGHFSTIRGWTDPFRLMSLEDPDGTKLSSILVQDRSKPFTTLVPCLRLLYQSLKVSKGLVIVLCWVSAARNAFQRN